MSEQQIFVCEPAEDQSRAVIRFLRRWRPDLIITGVLFGNSPVPKISGVAGFVRWDEIRENRPVATSMIPTGALSTRLMLQNEDVVCGAETLTQKALRVYEKQWLIRVAEREGIPVPITWINPAVIDNFPVFFKAAFEHGGGVRGVAKKREKLPEDQIGELIYQEVIKSQGTYGVAFIARNGVVVTSFTHYERHSFPALGGSAVCIEQFNDSRLNAYTERLLKVLSYSGWGLAEFKYCPRRADYVLMEINAKLWASCEFTFWNEPKFLRRLFGIEATRQNIHRMIFFHRFAARGPAFMARNIALLLSSRIVDYGKGLQTFIRSFVPDFIIACLRRVVPHRPIQDFVR